MSEESQMQMLSNHFAQALRRIADGCENPQQVAKKALEAKMQDVLSVKT